ncbi:hypothetical protein ACLOJK_015022 [Asimina triloba]
MAQEEKESLREALSIMLGRDLFDAACESDLIMRLSVMGPATSLEGTMNTTCAFCSEREHVWMVMTQPELAKVMLARSLGRGANYLRS